MNLIKSERGEKSTKGKAVVLLRTVREGILAEKALLKNGFTVRKVAPPPEFRKGCEISVEIDLNRKEAIEIILVQYKIEHQGIIPL